MRRGTRLGAAAGCLGLLLWAGAVRGETEEEKKAAARAAAQKGITAYEQERYAQSADLMGRAESLYHAPTHLLYLARSYAKLGRLVVAQEKYILLTREKLGPDAPEVFQQAVAEGRRELELLEPRIPTLTIEVKAKRGAKVTVSMDGVTVSEAMIGMDRPVDPGVHTVMAEAPGYRTDSESVTLKEGAQESLELVLEELPRAERARLSSGTEPGEERGARPIPAYSAFGVAAVGVGLGTWSALRWNSKRSDADSEWEGCFPYCTSGQKESVDSTDRAARRAGNLAIASYCVGAAGVAAGVTLLVLTPKKHKAAATQPQVAGWLGVGGGGIAGRF